MSPTEPTELQATGHRTAEFVEYNKPFYFILYQLLKKLLFKKKFHFDTVSCKLVCKNDLLLPLKKAAGADHQLEP